MVRDIWEESDENGTVRMATLQTVSNHNITINNDISINFNYLK